MILNLLTAKDIVFKPGVNSRILKKEYHLQLLNTDINIFNHQNIKQ